MAGRHTQTLAIMHVRVTDVGITAWTLMACTESTAHPVVREQLGDMAAHSVGDLALFGSSAHRSSYQSAPRSGENCGTPLQAGGYGPKAAKALKVFHAMTVRPEQPDEPQLGSQPAGHQRRR